MHDLKLDKMRRNLLGAGVTTASVSFVTGWPSVARSQAPLALRFRTIPDPDGWHPSLRLKGDWLIFEITDGALSGFGEASHSRDDPGCQRAATEIFARDYGAFDLTLENLARKEAEIATRSPSFVEATAYSGLNQALYDLLAKREQVPVWRLFSSSAPIERVPLYATINRALQTRSNEEYSAIVAGLRKQGFKAFKCAPFEKVDTPENAVVKSRAGLETLRMLRGEFEDGAIRVDFHERFHPTDFFRLLPELEELALDWIEEPFAMGDDYTELKSRTHLRVAGGELFWGRERFETITENAWVDVIMPDVKHVGGFGPLIDVLRMGRGRIEISPHNPSGPISTAASLHAAALFPETVRSLEYAFDRAGSRRSTGEAVENGFLYLADRSGWGVEPELA